MSLWRVRTSWSGLPGTPWVSTHYFQQALLGAVEAAEAVGAFWEDMDPQISLSALWVVEGDVTEIDQVTGATIGLSPVTPIAGSGSAGGDRSPAAAQGLIRWRTGVYAAGREIRGRTFIPGVCESSGASVPLPAYMAALNAAAATLILTPGFSVWSKTHGLAPSVDGGFAWNQYAVLRSRRD
jgi:hypothetical protein